MGEIALAVTRHASYRYNRYLGGIPRDGSLRPRVKPGDWQRYSVPWQLERIKQASNSSIAAW